MIELFPGLDIVIFTKKHIPKENPYCFKCKTNLGTLVVECFDCDSNHLICIPCWELKKKQGKAFDTHTKKLFDMDNKDDLV